MNYLSLRAPELQPVCQIELLQVFFLPLSLLVSHMVLKPPPRYYGLLLTVVKVSHTSSKQHQMVKIIFQAMKAMTLGKVLKYRPLPTTLFSVASTLVVVQCLPLKDFGREC